MSVATVYAKALFESIPPGTHLDHLEGELSRFGSLTKSSKEIQTVLLGPAVSQKEKDGIVAEISKKFGLSSIATLFIQLLVRKGRLGMLTEIQFALNALRLQSEGGVSGRLVSAEPMPDGDVQELAQAFEKKLGKKVAFQVSSDPTLLAGMKVTVNGVTYDGTLRAQLQRMRDGIMSGATH